MNNKYQYRLLPGGNSDEFPSIISFLLDRGVNLEESKFPSSGIMFRWPVEDTSLMPSEEGEPYFGDEESGYSIFNISDETAENWVLEMGGGPWQLTTL